MCNVQNVCFYLLISCHWGGLLTVSDHMNHSNFHVKVLLALLTAAAAAHAQSFHPGRCPQPSVQEDFDVTKYMGTWYEIEKLPAVFERGKCNQATYSLRPDGTVKVLNAELLSNGKRNTIQGVAKVKDSSKPAILGVSFFKDGPYWVLSTDYRSYSLVYSCTDYFLFHVDFAWILARTRVLTEDVMSRLRDTLSSAGVDVNRLAASNQTGCDAVYSPDYFVVIIPGEGAWLKKH
uniref:Apolipoprotein D n=1 Tax=Cyclopterus lumpus TaxID=8103 RepID=A0A8C2XF44_CYCLU